MKKYIEELNTIFEREAVCDENDEELFKQANEKFSQILQDAVDDGWDKEKIELVRSFSESNDEQKRKILSYCVDFFDPTLPEESTTTQSEEDALFEYIRSREFRQLSRENQDIIRHRYSTLIKLKCNSPRKEKCSRRRSREDVVQHAYLKPSEFKELTEFVNRHREDTPFRDVVLEIMTNHGMKETDVYKGALMRKQDFYRVLHPDCRNVTRRMVWQMIIGLHCSMEEAKKVLHSAGYIRRKTKLDLTMQYFIERENYDIEAIDDALEEFGLKTFTCG